MVASLTHKKKIMSLMGTNGTYTTLSWQGLLSSIHIDKYIDMNSVTNQY